MKKAFVLAALLSFILLGLSWRPADAFIQATQTPLGTFAFNTATNIPSTATGTPLPDCPGSIENIFSLDPEWAASCSHCIATPTTTGQYVIGTPVANIPTSTPGGPTATVVPTASSTPNSEWELHIEESIGEGHQAGSSQFTMEVNPEVAGRIIGMVVLYADQPSAQQARNLTSETGYSGFSTWSGGNLAGQAVVIWGASSTFNPPDGGAAQAAFAAEHGYLSWTGGFGEFWVPGQEAGYIGMWIAQIGPGYASNFQPYGYVYFGEPLNPEPTPVPNVCSVPVYRNETPIVDYGGFDQLGSTCYTLIPGFSFTVPSIFGLNEEFTLASDTYQLCVQWYSFPELSILDITIPLDLVILPASVWLFRRFMEL